MAVRHTRRLEKMYRKRLLTEYRLGDRMSFYFSVLFVVKVLSVSAICAFVLLIAHWISGFGGKYYLLYALAAIPITNALVGIGAWVFGGQWYKRQTMLVDSINRVASGDLSVILDPEQAGVWRNVYQNFNVMVAGLKSNQLFNERFINNFSHELKTPIASIRGFAEVLLTEEITNEERRMYLEIIAAESARLADLSHNVLLLSKIDAQNFIPVKAFFELDEQIKNSIILLSASWEKKNISFSAELASARYWGNEELLHQVWLNLLTNAIKFTPVGGNINVELILNDDWITVAITDTGIGMSEEMTKHIFEPYYQGNSAKTTEGSGLGLAIVAQIIELHQGSITVKSTENVGSTFQILLPLKKQV